MNPGCPDEYQTEEFMKSIYTVFLTHGYFDHTSGLEKLLVHNPECIIVAQYELAMIFIARGGSECFFA